MNRTGINYFQDQIIVTVDDKLLKNVLYRTIRVQNEEKFKIRQTLGSVFVYLFFDVTLQILYTSFHKCYSYKMDIILGILPNCVSVQISSTLPNLQR